MLSHLLSALYPKVTVLFNISFTPLFHETRHIRWEGEQIFGFFFLKRLYGYYNVANHADLSTYVQIFDNVRIFKIFSYFWLWKNKNKIRIYYINEYEKFFLEFLHIFSKTVLSLYCYKLYKFMKIWYNRFQHLSEFHQIIKHFYNFLKSKHKISISFL